MFDSFSRAIFVLMKALLNQSDFGWLNTHIFEVTGVVFCLCKG